MKGGVVGGSIMKGVLKVVQLVEGRPGIFGKDANGNYICRPIYARVVSLCAEQNELQFAVHGGLIGLGTTMDPALSHSDMLVGQVLGEVGSLPEAFIEIEIRNILLLRQLLGIRTKDTRQEKVSKLVEGEILLLNISSMAVGAQVITARDRRARLQLNVSVCTSAGDKVVLSCRVAGHWCLVGWGEIQGGTTPDIPSVALEFI